MEKEGTYSKLIKKLEEIKIDYANYEKRKQAIRKFLEHFFEGINITERSIQNLSQEEQAFYHEAKNRASCVQLFDNLNVYIEFFEDDIKTSHSDEALRQKTKEFTDELVDIIRIFVTGVMSNYYEESEINERLMDLIDQESLKDIIDIVFELCNNKLLNDIDRQEKLREFKNKLEATYPHNRDEYRKGINYYFKLKFCSEEELNSLYKEKYSELFGNKNVK